MGNFEPNRVMIRKANFPFKINVINFEWRLTHIIL